MTWEALTDLCARCRRCALAQTRKNVVFGKGNRSAPLLFVGEGPGAQEDEQGVPFVGQAGKLLDLALEACGFTPELYYITNVVKCRPAAKPVIRFGKRRRHACHILESSSG